MQRLSTPVWQSTCLKNGPAYTDSAQVLEQYEAFAKSAFIMGREDIAEALNSRLSPDFVKANAGVLKVLYGLKDQPLNKPLATNKPSEPQKSDQEVWNEIIDEMDDIEPPTFVEDSLSSWSESDNTSVSNTQERTPSGSPAPASIWSNQLSGVFMPWLIAPKPLHVHVPTALSEHELVREFKLKLLGNECRLDDPRLTSTDLSGALVDALFSEIFSMASILAHLRALENDAYIGAAIREYTGAIDRQIIDAKPHTILQAVAVFEAIVSPLHALGGLDTNYYASLGFLHDSSFSNLYLSALQPLLQAVDRWLAGEQSFIVQVREGELDWETFQVHLPSFLAQAEPLLLNAGKCAFFAARMGLSIYCPPNLDGNEALLPQIAAVSAAVSDSFMDAVRPVLKQTWENLAGVYLAQDPRMLSVIYECLSIGLPLAAGSNRLPTERTQAQAILDIYWPQAPFTFDKRLFPQLEISAVARNVFSTTSLQALWADIVKVMATPSDLGSLCSVNPEALEVEMLSRRYAQQIQEAVNTASGLARLV